MGLARVCAVVGCGRPVLTRGWCSRHYTRAHRYGDPEYVPPRRPRADLTGRRFGRLVVLEHAGGRYWSCRCECGRVVVVASSSLTGGTTFTCGDRRTHRRTDDAGYTAAHDRVRRDLGDVRQRACVDCGRPAAHWSYEHDDPGELVTADGVPYSLDPARYAARCVSCHKRWDLAFLRGRRLPRLPVAPVQGGLF